MDIIYLLPLRKICENTGILTRILPYKDRILGSVIDYQSHKMVKHTQTIPRQIVDELFECV